MNKGLLSGFMVKSSDVGAINIYHLLFADDTLIFSRANLDNLCNLRCTSLCFEAGSGMKINLVKSELVLVGNANNVEGLAGSLVF
jgi:hypothetical protein